MNVTIEGMTCASCSSLIENMISQEKGVKEVQVNLLEGTGRIVFDSDVTGPRTLINAINDVCFAIILLSLQLGYVAKLAENKASADAYLKKEELRRLRRDLLISLAFSFPVVLIGMVFHRIKRKYMWLSSNVWLQLCKNFLKRR